jgi:hypothetical protein
VPAGARGDAYAFLYPPGVGPPLLPAQPSFATGVSDARLAAADSSYLFAEIPPNPYHLWAFLEPNRAFGPTVDVLAQPGAGGRASAGVELNLEPGQDLAMDVPLDVLYSLEPPAFELEGLSGPEIAIPDQPGAIIAFTLQTTALGFLDPSRLGFSVSLPDAGDPLATTNSLGVATVYPQVFLRFVPEPGQTVPTDSEGNPAEVLLPFAFNSAPYLITLGTDTSASVVAPSLTVVMVPEAQAVTYPAGGKPTVTALSAIPVGAYELWVLQKSGQYWRIPNDLGTSAGAPLGGPFASQAIQFSVFHGSVFDAGAP